MSENIVKEEIVDRDVFLMDGDFSEDVRIEIILFEGEEERGLMCKLVVFLIKEKRVLYVGLLLLDNILEDGLIIFFWYDCSWKMFMFFN